VHLSTKPRFTGNVSGKNKTVGVDDTPTRNELLAAACCNATKTCISPWNSQAQSGRGSGCMQGSKLLIVGFSGYIGTRIISRIGLQNVIAAYRGNYVNGGVPFDVSMMRLADRFLRGSHGISHAMLLQGITKIDRCAEAPVETAKVNDGSTIRAIDDLLNASVKPIFISRFLTAPNTSQQKMMRYARS
jgi:hypothetical protein